MMQALVAALGFSALWLEAIEPSLIVSRTNESVVLTLTGVAGLAADVAHPTVRMRRVQPAAEAAPRELTASRRRAAEEDERLGGHGLVTLHVQLPADLLAAPADYLLFVLGDRIESNGALLRVVAPPSILAVDPAVLPAVGGVEFAVYGSGFVPAARAALRLTVGGGGGAAATVPAQYVNTRVLRARTPAVLLEAPVAHGADAAEAREAVHVRAQLALSLDGGANFVAALPTSAPLEVAVRPPLRLLLLQSHRADGGADGGSSADGWAHAWSRARLGVETRYGRHVLSRVAEGVPTEPAAVAARAEEACASGFDLVVGTSPGHAAGLEAALLRREGACAGARTRLVAVGHRSPPAHARSAHPRLAQLRAHTAQDEALYLCGVLAGTQLREAAASGSGRARGCGGICRRLRWWRPRQAPPSAEGGAADGSRGAAVLGFVASHATPEARLQASALARGCRAANPRCEVRVLVTGAWHEPRRERAAASRLWAVDGARVIASDADSLAAARVFSHGGPPACAALARTAAARAAHGHSALCVEQGEARHAARSPRAPASVVGVHADMRELLASEAALVSAVADWSGDLISLVGDVISLVGDEISLGRVLGRGQEWGPDSPGPEVVGGVGGAARADGGARLSAPSSHVSAEARAELERARAELRSGQRAVFCATPAEVGNAGNAGNAGAPGGLQLSNGSVIRPGALCAPQPGGGCCLTEHALRTADWLLAGAAPATHTVRGAAGGKWGEWRPLATGGPAAAAPDAATPDLARWRFTPPDERAMVCERGYHVVWPDSARARGGGSGAADGSAAEQEPDARPVRCQQDCESGVYDEHGRCDAGYRELAASHERLRTWQRALGRAGAALGAGLAAVLLLRAWQRRHAEELQRRQWLEGEVEAALQARAHLQFPLCVVPLGVFAHMGALLPYEQLRDRGVHEVHDDIPAALSALEQQRLIFISHQWESWSAPDPRGAQYALMVATATRVAALNGWPLETVRVWVDYMCVPQAHPKLQALAIASLGYYASLAHACVAVAPPGVHADTHEPCGRESWQRRLWCRLELLCFALANGIDQMFIAPGGEEAAAEEAAGDQSAAAPARIAEADLSAALLVFEGECTCCRLGHVFGGMARDECDREQLVGPILGLYGELFLAHLEKAHEESVARRQDGNKPGSQKPDSPGGLPDAREEVAARAHGLSSERLHSHKEQGEKAQLSASANGRGGDDARACAPAAAASAAASPRGVPESPIFRKGTLHAAERKGPLWQRAATMSGMYPTEEPAAPPPAPSAPAEQPSAEPLLTRSASDSRASRGAADAPRAAAHSASTPPAPLLKRGTSCRTSIGLVSQTAASQSPPIDGATLRKRTCERARRTSMLEMQQRMIDTDPAQRMRMFPRDFEFSRADGSSERRELFGDLIAEMERFCRRLHAQVLADAEAAEAEAAKRRSRFSTPRNVSRFTWLLQRQLEAKRADPSTRRGSGVGRRRSSVVLGVGPRRRSSAGSEESSLPPVPSLHPLPSAQHAAPPDRSSASQAQHGKLPSATISKLSFASAAMAASASAKLRQRRRGA